MTEPSANNLALEALRLCTAGCEAEGVDRYRRALALSGGTALPVGLHCQLLEGSGHGEAGRSIRVSALRAGADVSSCPLQRPSDLRTGAEEYRSLLDRGIANAQMVANYMACLSRIGDSEALAAVAAPGLLFRTGPLALNNRESVLDDAINVLLNAHQRERQRAYRSIRDMDRVAAAHKRSERSLAAIHEAVLAAMRAYADEVRASGHMLARWLPQDFQLYSWGVISDGMGHNVPHLHAGCWIVGVLYLAGEGESAGAAGHLQVGPGLDGDETCQGWPRRSQAPIRGTLVLMPAYYTHWTTPLGRPGLRVSMAFNAAERLTDADPDAPILAVSGAR